MWKDKLGRDINIGDFILYARSSGLCNQLAVGKVIRYVTGSSGHYNNPVIEKLQIHNEHGGVSTIQSPTRIVVITDIYDPDTPILGHYTATDESRSTIDWER